MLFEIFIPPMFIGAPFTPTLNLNTVICNVYTGYLYIHHSLVFVNTNGNILGRLRLSYASNSRNPRVTRVPIEQPRSLEHVTIFDLD